MRRVCRTGGPVSNQVKIPRQTVHGKGISDKGLISPNADLDRNE